MSVKPPFSRRAGRPQPWVQEEWPKSARTALLHLLHDIADRRYVGSWVAIDKELRRIARELPAYYSSDGDLATIDARSSVESILTKLAWDKLFDFCERLYSHLASRVTRWNHDMEESEETISRDQAQQYIADELQRIFVEEHLGYTFDKGEVHRRGRGHTRELIARAEPTLGDSRLQRAREHYMKAQQYFEHPSRPDYENAVKEAVCAVEAAARNLFPDTNAKTLGDFVKKVHGAGSGQLPKPLAETISGLYAYRSSGDGVSHGGADGGKVTPAIAEYVMALAASQVILLHELARANEADVPF